MKNQIEEKWNNILELMSVEHGVSDAIIATWIKPLKIYQVTDTTITFVLDSKFDNRAIEFIKQKLYDMYLKVCIQEIFNKNYEIEFILYNEISKPKDIKVDNKVFEKIIEESNLNPKYTFDTFIIGENNRIAHATCIAVAEAPGKSYNPLFLYGGAGLGKTHLMHSIAHYILQHNSNMKVLYTTSEAFTNDLIESIKRDKTEEFREKYRNIDVLLIDDIQFIVSKERTQEEFFHTFNVLYESKKQIIVSSDKPPKEMHFLEERLISRFEWGLPVDIKAPEYETRMAILRKKAELSGITVPDEVIQYIANNIISNIRELEGALNKISVYAKFAKVDITVEMAEEALKDLISQNVVHEVTPDLIIRVVAEHYNIPYSDIISNKRSKDIAYTRQVAMYLCRSLTDKSLQSIGESLGGRDHTTILHGAEKIENELQTNKSLGNTIDIIKKKISPT